MIALSVRQSSSPSPPNPVFQNSLHRQFMLIKYVVTRWSSGNRRRARVKERSSRLFLIWLGGRITSPRVRFGAGGQGVTLELAWGPSYSSLRNLHFSFAVFCIFSFNIIIVFFLFTFFFCGEIMFFMFFLIRFWYLSLAFFLFLLFYLFFLLLSTPGKILAESHNKAPITTFSTIFSHREILSNRLPNGSKYIRFRYGHRKRAPAQPLEDISSEWNPQPPC